MLSIRLAEKRDFDFFFELKSEDFNVFWAGASDKPEKEHLRQFFYDAIDHAGDLQARKIYIIENEDHEKVGHLYITPNGEEHGLPCAILQRFCGRGYAKEAIRLGFAEAKRLGFKRFVGAIREDNIASMKAYTACGARVTDKYRETFIPKLNKNVKMYIVVYDYYAD